MKAVCIEEPRGLYGMEGFLRGNLYDVSLRCIKGKKYYRVYHTRHYYECCGPRIFGRFFELVKEEQCSP